MGKKITLGTAITLIIIAIAITISLTMVLALRNFNEKVSSITERENMFAKFTEIDNYVRQNRGDIDEEELMDSVAKGYLSGIDDPYALYMSAEAYSAYVAASSQTVAGVGISASMDSDGYMLVGKVYEGSTAASAGILPGDLIIKVDDINLSADTYADAEALLIGEAGTKVTLKVRRNGEDTEMEITRRVLTPTNVATIAFDNHYYIRVDSFTESTPDQFSKAVEKAISAGAQYLVFDVRSVSSGLISSAATILDRLVGSGDMLYVEYNDGSKETLYTSNSRETDIPMVVLVNEGTSGAAEFFAAGLRDFGKAKIVGTQTAGVGSLQKIYKLDDGSAIQLTIGKYYLANSETAWEGVGINPDHAVSLGYVADFSNLSTIDPSIDTQLAKAIEVVSAAINTNVDEENSESGSGEENNG
ncbi:MAG: S41 family peptidase [Oscillospiraceae bacterium]|nr:S41 family peptidase [Oscillospiraceae bacterium]